MKTQEQAISKFTMFCSTLAVLLALCGCGAEPASRSGSVAAAENHGECSPDQLTATCTCAGQNGIPGRQTCVASTWSECECVAAPAGSAGFAAPAADGGTTDPGVLGEPLGNDSPTRFAWQRTPFELGTCKAGHYIGNFVGWYGSPAAFTAPVPVASVAGADGAPGLEFWLEKVPGSGELFAINHGKIRGTADGLFPFTIDLTGTLDCKTKKFVGKLENGVYEVIGTKYMFEGNASADYDKLQNEFLVGKWDAKEPTSPFPTAGGSGDWDATWSAQ